MNIKPKKRGPNSISLLLKPSRPIPMTETINSIFAGLAGALMLAWLLLQFLS